MLKMIYLAHAEHGLHMLRFKSLFFYLGLPEENSDRLQRLGYPSYRGMSKIPYPPTPVCSAISKLVCKPCRVQTMLIDFGHCKKELCKTTVEYV